jgi:hypothetical protein
MEALRPRPDALQPDRHAADLDWIAGILSAPPIEASVTRAGSPGTGRAVQTLGVFPSAARPRLLLSLESARAAAALLRGGSHAREVRVRLGRALLRASLRVGLAQHLLRDRLRFVLGETTGAAPGLATVLLSEHLAEVLYLSELSFAVRLGRVRPNRKPLIHVVGRDGTPVSYVKVGWNALTRGLVAREAEVLETVEGESRAAFAAPRVLYHGSWHGLELLALSPLDGRLVRGGQHLGEVLRAMLEIARLSDVEEHPLAESPYWRSLRDRIVGLGANEDAAALADRVEARWGHGVLTFGSWHGDWTPWNMARQNGTLAVWDWERSAEGVPVGLDAAHFDVQVALAANRHRWEAALPEVLDGDKGLLRHLPNAGDARLLVALDLLEMALRAAEGREAGITSDDRIYVPALQALLER